MSAEGGTGLGDILDWERLVDDVLPRLYHYFWYRVGDGRVAEDLVGETFERAWRSRGGYRRALGVEAQWIFGIGKRVAADHFRRVRSSEAVRGVGRTAGRSAEEEAERHEESELLRKLLHGLGERDRELVAMKYGAGLSNREIARLTGLTESNVGTILHRVVLWLRERWETGK